MSERKEGDTVRCNNCWWHGAEEDLKLMEDPEITTPEDRQFMKACPNCETDGCLMDLPLKLNNSDNFESFDIYLDETKHPIAFNNKVKELVGLGMDREEAKSHVRTTPFQMELYYELGCGLMAVEAELTTSGTIYSPYTGEMYEGFDENI